MKSKLFKKVVASMAAVTIVSQFAFVMPASAATYYSQDYESVTDATSWVSPNAQGNVTLETDNTKYIQFAPGNANSRGAQTEFTGVDTSALNEYVVEFDMALTAGNNQNTIFALAGKDVNNWGKNDGATSGYILRMEATNSANWALNGTDTLLNVPAGNWYHYKVIVDKAGKMASLTISSDTEEIAKQQIVGINGNGDVKGILHRSGRYNGVIKIDNIVVRDKEDTDEFGEIAKEQLSAISFAQTPPARIYQPEEGQNVDYPISIKGEGTYGNDVSADIESVEWSIKGNEADDSYIKFAQTENDKLTANLNILNGVGNYYCYITATAKMGDVEKTITTPVAILGSAAAASGVIAPEGGYPEEMNAYPDSLVGYYATSNAIDSKDVILNNWSIYGSNGARTLTLNKDEDGTKYLRFASNGGGGSTVAVYQLPEQANQYIVDMKVRFTGGDMTFGHYFNTPNNSNGNANWTVSYSGGGLNVGTESISGVSGTDWTRVVVSADESVGTYSAKAYSSDGTLLGEVKDAPMAATAGEVQKYFCFHGSYPVDLARFKIYIPTVASLTLNSDVDTVKVPEAGEEAAKATLSASVLTTTGEAATGAVQFALEEEYANVTLDSTGAQTAELTIGEGASGSVTVIASKDGKSAVKTINLTTSSNVVAFTKSTSSITIPFDGEDAVEAEFTAETRDNTGAAIDGGAITYALLAKDGVTETTVKGVTFENGKMTVAPGASPAVVFVKATNAEGLATKVKVNIHGLSFAFGSAEPEEGLTAVTAESQYSDKLGYGFADTSVLTNEETAVKGSAAYQFKAAVPNGNYVVDVKTTAGTIKSEVIDVPAATGITRGVTDGAAKFNVAVCDGVLDMTFDADTSVSSVSIAQAAPKSELAKPAIYAIGDSTTKNGGNGTSWGQVAGNFLDTEVFTSFANHGKAGDDSVVYYNAGRIENVLLAVCPGDYVTINMGINSKTAGEPASYNTIMTKYLVEGVMQRGAIPVILTHTPQGPVGNYAGNYANGVFTCNRGSAQHNQELRDIAAQYSLNLIDVSMWGDTYFNSLTDADVANTELHGTHLANSAAPTTVQELVQSWYADHNHYDVPFANTVAQYILGELAKIEKGEITVPVIITFDNNGEKTTSNVSELTELPTPTAPEGKEFTGWFTASEGGDQVTLETLKAATENMTVYAQYKDAPVVPVTGMTYNAETNKVVVTSSADDNAKEYVLILASDAGVKFVPVTMSSETPVEVDAEAYTKSFLWKAVNGDDALVPVTDSLTITRTAAAE